MFLEKTIYAFPKEFITLGVWNGNFFEWGQGVNAFSLEGVILTDWGNVRFSGLCGSYKPNMTKASPHLLFLIPVYDSMDIKGINSYKSLQRLLKLSSVESMAKTLAMKTSIASYYSDTYIIKEILFRHFSHDMSSHSPVSDLTRKHFCFVFLATNSLTHR